ncbi:histidine phosphatase family protein [Proteiniclasticum sp. SCR006]|uniref:Histidine phosphatase family protein n=1 Tax=Proteiniclasticum aestuarii TaxID=2817862 RepID=A0A939H9Z5_9CLOT|nr:histidine phosphatase family protein [Proteiniclasticum aestuarii]MBO1264191.1 histidine phosphatase family protein [Proteiniclasticum aestuarii]
MTEIYLVRHAKPDHSWEEDETRPLTEEGMADARIVRDYFREIHVDGFISSPFRRSIDTIRISAEEKRMSIKTDRRLREREKGPGGNTHELFRKRWADFSFHEDEGESLEMVQKRNMEALHGILEEREDQSVVIGTHGTAMSTILHHYDPAFSVEDFLRIIDFMPYIVRLTFQGKNLTAKEELLYVKKEYDGK